jgi:hypothetical protein
MGLPKTLLQEVQTAFMPSHNVCQNEAVSGGGKKQYASGIFGIH